MNGPGSVAVRTRFAVAWRQWLHQTRLETTQTLNSAPFIVLLILGLMFVIPFAWRMGENSGVPVFPLTYLMLRSIGLTMHMILVIIVVFYAGELVRRERSAGVDEVFNALPVPDAVYLGAKLAALALVVAVFMASSIVTTVGVQIARGYYHFEPGLYFSGFFVETFPFLLIAVLAVFLQVMTNNRFTGYLLMVVVIASRFGLPALGMEHNLYRYAGYPAMRYSDLNGYGHSTRPFVWFNLYWSLVAAVLVMLSLLLWVRGTETSFRDRLAIARRRCGPAMAAALAAAVIGALATGAYIFYNTNVLADYRPRNERIRRLAEYEKRYGQYREAALPRITAVTAEVDIFPDQRRAQVRGLYQLVNPGDQAILELPVTVAPRNDHGHAAVRGKVTLERFEPGQCRLATADDELGFYLYELDSPIAPGETREVAFQVSVSNPGFRNSRLDNRIVGNGSFFASRSYLPLIGYSRTNQLGPGNARRRHGLPAAERMGRVDDQAALTRSYLEADWINLETTVSTARDQIAIAPGSLLGEWVDGQRRYFRYRTDAPILNFFVYLSGRYQVRREQWKGISIEVYYHPGHAWNIDRLVDVTRQSLDYYSAAFGPYPHRQLRIVEIPNYAGLTAFALAGTIPFSEAWGFIQEMGAGDIDVLSYITAHEIAHQWWNHQVIGGAVQGTTMISEALSQYSALMVIEKAYGAPMVRQILKHELDRYLSQRGHEQIQEQPLLLVENQQYIHYRKGSLVMYALRDYIGEDRVNRALRRFLEANAFKGPPFPNSLELLDYIRAEVPPEYAYLIEDMFETITSYDNRLVRATYRAREDGTYLVRILTTARKLRADGQGVETEIPINDWVDIGVFGSDGALLFLEKRHLTATENSFDVVVPERPVSAGIDPYTKLIDRDSGDNLKNVQPTQ